MPQKFLADADRPGNLPLSGPDANRLGGDPAQAGHLVAGQIFLVLLVLGHALSSSRHKKKTREAKSVAGLGGFPLGVRDQESQQIISAIIYGHSRS